MRPASEPSRADVPGGRAAVLPGRMPAGRMLAALRGEHCAGRLPDGRSHPEIPLGRFDPT